MNILERHEIRARIGVRTVRMRKLDCAWRRSFFHGKSIFSWRVQTRRKLDQPRLEWFG